VPLRHAAQAGQRQRPQALDVDLQPFRDLAREPLGEAMAVGAVLELPGEPV
jgi:hypothetical protein